MRRPLLALALLAGVVGATTQQASTASNSITESTAVYRGTTVTGATLLSMGYTVVGNDITAVAPKLRGDGLVKTLTNLTPKTVTARFGSDTPVLCVEGTSSLLDSMTGHGEVTYDCAGLVERSDRPAELHIGVS